MDYGERFNYGKIKDDFDCHNPIIVKRAKKTKRRPLKRIKKTKEKQKLSINFVNYSTVKSFVIEIIKIFTGTLKVAPLKSVSG